MGRTKLSERSDENAAVAGQHLFLVPVAPSDPGHNLDPELLVLPFGRRCIRIILVPGAFGDGRRHLQTRESPEAWVGVWRLAVAWGIARGQEGEIPRSRQREFRWSESRAPFSRAHNTTPLEKEAGPRQSKS